MALSPNHAVIHVALPLVKRDELRELAVRDGQSTSAYVRALLYRHMREQNGVAR